MLKKHSIIALLLVAYTIVLAHSIVPHHHHNETEQTASHHHDDDQEEDNSIAHSFANYLHSGDAAVIHEQPDNSIASHTFIALYFIYVFEFTVRAFESPPPVRQLAENIITKSLYYLSSKGLRGPPFSLV